MWLLGCAGYKKEKTKCSLHSCKFALEYHELLFPWITVHMKYIQCLHRLAYANLKTLRNCWYNQSLFIEVGCH